MAQHLRECSYFLLLVEDTLQEQHTMRGEVLVRSKLFFLKPVEHCHDTTRLSCITGQCVYFIEILRRLKSVKRNVDRLLDWQSALFGYCSRLKQFKFNQSQEGIFACDLNEFRSLTANIIVIVSAHQFGQYARSQVHGSPRLLRTRSRSSTRVVSSRALCGGLNK